MRIYKFLILPLLFFFYGSTAQVKPEPKQHRILLLLDGSSSMLQPWSADKERFKAAATVIAKLIDSIYSVNDQVEFALRVYGHQSPAQENNCLDTRREVKFSKDNLTQIELRLASLHPYGVSPIAYSIKRAAEDDMTNINDNSYSLILITDGGESCGGDICEISRQLLARKINFKPYILSLVDYTPLKGQYDCLGEYMVVTKEADIPPVVGKIVEAYRPMLTLARTDNKPLPASPRPTQPIPPARQPVYQAPAPVKEPEPVKPPEVFVARHKGNTTKLQPWVLMHRLPQMWVTPSFRSAHVPNYDIPVPEPEVAVQQPAPKEEPIIAVVANEKPIVSEPRPMPPPPMTTTEKPLRAPMIDPLKPKEAKFSLKHEEAEETTVEVHFTDGRGKFYSTTPQVLLLDPKTNKQAHKFWRTVGPNGAPDPQKEIPVGTYNLTVANKANLIVRNIEIKENTRNIITVLVGKASLIFTYQGNRDRPVTEYTAVVNRRFEPGPTIWQKCTKELEYEAGNYYIEVNTLPVLKRNLDLDFDYVYDLQIPEDGMVNFTNANYVGRVDLYTPLGDKFMKFHSLEVAGSPGGQPLKLQPGVYEAHFLKNPKLPNQVESVIRFFIKSNMITDIELR